MECILIAITLIIAGVVSIGLAHYCGPAERVIRRNR